MVLLFKHEKAELLLRFFVEILPYFSFTRKVPKENALSHRKRGKDNYFIFSVYLHRTNKISALFGYFLSPERK